MKKYEDLKIEIIEFEETDVITESTPPNQDPNIEVDPLP